MNTPTQPPPLHLDGSPEFDLDHNDAWPMPTAQPVAPVTMTDRVREWIERKLAG